jgi:biopolymer transport protein ExbB/TolQ
METATIILLSVLSTLGVVAIISMVVVAFYKLGRKVDTLENNVFKSLEETREEMYRISTAHSDELCLKLDEIRREMDSRFDKTHEKIKFEKIKFSKTDLSNSSEPLSQLENKKQVLQG